MPRPKMKLKELLIILNKKPCKKGEIKKELNITRQMELKILKEAIQRKWIYEDGLGFYHLTPLGQREIELSIPKFPSKSFSIDVMSQVINVLPLHKERPKINCTIQIDEAKKIEKLDSETVSIKRFLTRDGLGLVENDTYLKASLAFVVDSLLDHKAKSIRLNTLLDLQQSNEFLNNIKSNFPGYDYRKRMIELARTNFRVLIEYNGEKWIQKQNFDNLEQNLEDSQKFYKSFGENIKQLQRDSRIKESFYFLSGYDYTNNNNLSSYSLFNSEEELKQRIYDELKNNQVGNNKEIHKILDNAIKKDYITYEKKTVYHLKFNNTKAKEFYKSIGLAIDEKDEDIYKNESLLIQQNNKINQYETSIDQIIDRELKKIENFEKQFCILLKDLLNELDLSIHSPLYKEKKIKVLPEKTIKKLIKTVFQILYEILERYPLQLYLKYSDLDAKDHDKIVARIFLELMKSARRIKNYFITHTDYDFARTYCDNYDSLKICNNYTRISLNILQESINKENSRRFIEAVNSMLNNNL
jgi:hypothetical protein